MASLYIHIPFCERKCLYCDFYSVAGTEAVPAFLAALAREIALCEERPSQATYDTVFFGGGTPSLLAPQQLESVLSRLRTKFRIASDAEITLEANPGTVSENSLRAFRSLGINRLSLGIQSFHDDELNFLGRIHDRAEALRVVQWGRRAGFENVSLDLIYAIPDQSDKRWEASLHTALELAPQHIAAYSLGIEEGTPLARLVRTGAVQRQPTDAEAHMYHRTVELLSAGGYAQYEISNYARAGFRCRHNCAYWSHADYVGFGPSAHSFWKQDDGRRGRRWWNVADLTAYMDHLAHARWPIAATEDVDTTAMVQERILLGLRSSGLDLARLQSELGHSLDHRQNEWIHELIGEGLAVHEERLLRLTSKGYLLCDEICAMLCRQLRSDPIFARGITTLSA